MFSNYWIINLFNKISFSSDDLLQEAAELVAGEGDLLPGHVGENHLYDLLDQELLNDVGGSINIPFSDAPDITVDVVAVWIARGLNLLVGGCFRQLRSLFAFSNHCYFVAIDINWPFSEAIGLVSEVLLLLFYSAGS